MAISEASQLCVRFIFRNRMHRFWFRMFMFKERSLWCLRVRTEKSLKGFCFGALWIFVQALCLGWLGFVRTIRSVCCTFG
ncbi:hypothetical protein Ahy_B02g059259 isoform E [Arachis hypogaea]|uniref:Uncharacterized protein n=1 Tax=Arachis hypogaea TaxID=3818 RepID=A0A445AGB0_ARAHY|nr:hypothetical protein Ahy_B02g059259 isoform E [Arachis hypogaea]